MNYISRSFRLIVVSMGFAAFLGGCVSTGTYQQKEQESLMLNKSLDESRILYSNLQAKYKKLGEENTEQELELKKLKVELSESIIKNNGLVEVTKKLATDNNDLKVENEKLTTTNSSLSLKVKKLSTEFEDMKLAHEKLVIAVKPENILKTAGEYFAEMQQKIDKLTKENTSLGQALKEFRKAPETTVKEQDSKPAAAVTLPEKSGKEAVIPTPTVSPKTEPQPSVAEKSVPTLKDK